MKRWREPLLRGVVTAIFVGAGILKALDPTAFAFAIDRYRLLPWPASVAVALYLPWLEIIAATAGWFETTRAAGRVVLTGLTALFLAVLVTAWWRKLDIDCGCFGGASAGGLPWAITRATALLVTLWLLGVWERRPQQISNNADGRTDS